MPPVGVESGARSWAGMRLFWRIVKTVFSSLFLAIVVLVGAPAAFGVTVLAGLIFLPLPATIPVPKAEPDDPADASSTTATGTRSPPCSSTTATCR